MTTTRSIFQKVCPGCMANVARDIHECSCGYQFDHDDTDSNLSSEEIRLRAEELYESYLAARAEQAANGVKAVQAEFARDPASQEKSGRVAAAIQEMQTAEAALTAQATRVVEMRKALPPARQTTVSRPVPPIPKKRTAITKAAVAELPVRTVRKTVTPVVNVANIDSARAKNATKTTARIVQVKPKKPPVKVQAKAPIKAQVPALLPAPAAKKPQVVAPPPVQTTIPNHAFRQAQAAKADKILRAAHATKPVKVAKKEETSVSPPVVQAKAPPLASGQGKTAPRLYASNKKECPNCTSSVENNINRCRCGYEFSSSEQLIPGLSMSDEERAEFAKLFNF